MSETPEHLTAVARMYYLEGMGQSEIADLYQISRSTVSRMLTTARTIGIVQITVDDFDPRDRELEHRLIARFGLRRAIVVRGVSGQRSATRRAVAHFAAPEVARWITSGRRLGVTGGRTLGELVRAIPFASRTGTPVYQLMGAIATTPGTNEPGEVTRALGTRLQGPVHTLNVPAFVENAEVRDSFIAHDQVQAMWQVFDRLQNALVGVGSVSDSMFVDHGLLSKTTQKVLSKQGAVAEICGRFIDADGNEIDHPLRDRVLSIELNTLADIADVVAVTSGEAKGIAARAVLRGGLANSVVMDDACARAVFEIT